MAKAKAKAAPRKSGAAARKRKAKSEPKGTSKRGGRTTNGTTPKGARLTAAQQALRDTQIVTRKAQGWPWSEIAQEAGISVRAAKDAYKNKRETFPDLLDLDPDEIVRGMIEQLQASVGDLEVMARSYAERHPSAAVGAKRAADAARADLFQMLQAIGLLPLHLGELRVAVELKAVVVHLVDAVSGFEESIREMKLPKAQQRKVLNAASEVRGAMESIASGDGPAGTSVTIPDDHPR